MIRESSATKTRRHKNEEYEVQLLSEREEFIAGKNCSGGICCTYDGMIFDEELRLDVLVEELIIYVKGRSNVP